MRQWEEGRNGKKGNGIKNEIGEGRGKEEEMGKNKEGKWMAKKRRGATPGTTP